MSNNLEETATSPPPLNEDSTTTTTKLNETKKVKKSKPKKLDLNITQPSSSSLNENVSQAIAATLGVSTTTSTILAAATQATKKIAGETVKKAVKSKSKHHHHVSPEETESLLESFFPFDSSITTLLLGLDYIFYFWTLLLVLIVGYLTYYQYKKSKAASTTQPQEKLTIIEIFVKVVALFIVRPIYFVLRFLYVHLLKNVIKVVSSESNLRVNENSNLSSGLIDANAYSWLNNCFKWFYFSPENTKIINTNIVETLNSVKSQMGQSLQLVYIFLTKCIRLFFILI